MTDKLQKQLADRVLTVTLNRPDRLNAIDIEMLDALVGALEEAAVDEGVGAVVLSKNLKE